MFFTASSPGLSSDSASSAGEPSAAACSAARTTSSTWSSRTPARDTTPTLVPAARRLTAITVSCRERETPLVVSVLPAQRRFAVELSSAITMQSSERAAASARSTVSCGPVACGVAVRHCVLRGHAPSSAVLSTRTPRISAVGQPWLTGATCPGWPFPQLNAPSSRYVCGPPTASMEFQKSVVVAW